MFDRFDSQLWKRIIESIQEGLMLIDQEGKVVFVNKAFEQLLGYRSEEIVGKTCEVLQCDRCFKTRANGQDKYCALFKKGGETSSQCTFVRQDGSTAHLLKNATIIKDSQGRVLGGIETLIDLSKIVAKEKIIENLRQQLHFNEGFLGIVAKSQAMRQVFDLTSSAAKSEAPVIIYGESGTGKELIAAAVHELSPRKEGPFIKVNCAALNENLLESELFGHVKGAFTGADYQRIGRFEAAHGGTIFLDEIGDLPMTTQTKILRVLQEKEIERVGDHRPFEVDVRVISATHKNLKELMEDGLFREDLYYRIGVIPVHLPPLRQRQSDIPLLVETFINRASEKSGKKIDGVTKEVLDFLLKYHWPGNVRELINIIEYTFVLCPGGKIYLEHLPGHLFEERSIPVKAKLAGVQTSQEPNRQKLIDALEKTGGNQSRAAGLLGVSRVTVWKWIKKYGVTFGPK